MSASRRPVRAARVKKTEPQTHAYDPNLNSKFTLKEKQKVLEALKKYQVDSLVQIQKEYLPHRKIPEIDMFIKRMKMKAKEHHIQEVDVPHRAPIERWLQTAEDLTYHDFDYSYTLSQVMSIAGNLEPHDQKIGPQHPDWCKLYRYIVALLRGDRPPELGPVEAAVMLDLIQSLADQLKQMDSSDQRELMIRKFRLLTAQVDINNKEASYAACRRALEEDLLDPETQLAAISTFQTSPTHSPKKRGRKRKGEAPTVDPRPAKTALYSINPFCIPVKYLKLRPKSAAGTNTQVGGETRGGSRLREQHSASVGREVVCDSPSQPRSMPQPGAAHVRSHIPPAHSRPHQRAGQSVSQHGHGRQQEWQHSLPHVAATTPPGCSMPPSLDIPIIISPVNLPVSSPETAQLESQQPVALHPGALQHRASHSRTANPGAVHPGATSPEMTYPRVTPPGIAFAGARHHGVSNLRVRYPQTSHSRAPRPRAPQASHPQAPRRRAPHPREPHTSHLGAHQARAPHQQAPSSPSATLTHTAVPKQPAPFQQQGTLPHTAVPKQPAPYQQQGTLVHSDVPKQSATHQLQGSVRGNKPRRPSAFSQIFSLPSPSAAQSEGTRKIIITENPSGTTTINVPTDW